MLCSMTLPSTLCAALHGQSNVGSMCDCKTCRRLDLSGFYQELTVTMVQVPEGTTVSPQGQHYINIKKVKLTKDAPVSPHRG